MNKRIVLLFIIIIALFLRVVDISNNPLALYGDELTIGLDAYSILNTNHDQLGNFLPLTFPMGAGRPAGYVYGSIPFIVLFGPSALGVRALSLLSGLGIVLLLFLIGRRLFSEKLGLLAAAIAAVSPWEIALSRGGFEAHFALFLSLLGLYLFIKAKEKPFLYLFSALSFGLTLHTYPTYKVSLLLFLPMLVWFQGGLKNIFFNKGKKYFILSLILLIILGLIALSQTFIGGSETRFYSINVFSRPDLKERFVQKINLERNITNLPPLISKYFHNMVAEEIKVITENYLQNFSLDFLLIHGDRNPRHNMATMGEIYFADLILIIIGLFYFWHRSKKIILFLTGWLLLSPIPTALLDLPHALRSSFMLPPLIILSSLGLVTVLNRNKKITGLIGMIFIIQFIFFVQKLYFLAPNEYSSFWSYPAKLASTIAKQNENKYKYIFLSDKIDSIEFAYPIYAKMEASDIISQNQHKTILNNLKFKKFNNIYIGEIPNEEAEKFIQSLEGPVLYIANSSTANYLHNFEAINGRDSLVALILKKKQ